MTLEGHVQNGAIVLDDAARLPEGAKVRVEVLPGPSDAEPSNGAISAYDRIKSAVQQAKQQRAEPDAPTLAQRYASALGAAADLPADGVDGRPSL